MATGTYEVTAYGPIARREQNSTRRRAGIEFGREPIIVTTDWVADAVPVTEAQLDAILGDECLRRREVAPAPVPEPAAEEEGAEEEEELAEQAEEEGEEPAEVAPEPVAGAPAEHHQHARRGRPRKVR